MMSTRPGILIYAGTAEIFSRDLHLFLTVACLGEVAHPSGVEPETF
jgi:hypothetical protein